jgi:hypothetical protein
MEIDNTMCDDVSQACQVIDLPANDLSLQGSASGIQVDVY